VRCGCTSGEGCSGSEKPCPVPGEEELNVLEVPVRAVGIRRHRTLGFGNAVRGAGTEEHSLESCRWDKHVTVCHTNIT